MRGSQCWPQIYNIEILFQSYVQLNCLIKLNESLAIEASFLIFFFFFLNSKSMLFPLSKPWITPLVMMYICNEQQTWYLNTLTFNSPLTNHTSSKEVTYTNPP